MRPDNHQHRQDTKGVITAVVPAVLAMVLMLAGTMATVAMLSMEAFRPKVGDIVEFQKGLKEGDAWQLEVPAANVARRDPAAGPCMIDPDVIGETGGSLIVEARDDTAPMMYRLHWAGTHTAAGAGDCGPQADLTLSRTDLQKLANAVGGFGVGNKRLVW
jgi:hypothetical protein